MEPARANSPTDPTIPPGASCKPQVQLNYLTSGEGLLRTRRLDEGHMGWACGRLPLCSVRLKWINRVERRNIASRSGGRVISRWQWGNVRFGHIGHESHLSLIYLVGQPIIGGEGSAPQLESVWEAKSTEWAIPSRIHIGGSNPSSINSATRSIPNRAKSGPLHVHGEGTSLTHTDLQHRRKLSRNRAFTTVRFTI